MASIGVRSEEQAPVPSPAPSPPPLDSIPYVPDPFDFENDVHRKTDMRTIVFSHPSLNYLANSLCRHYSEHFRRGMMSWAHFPDGTPNFRFENPENLRQKDVVMLFNFRSLENVMEQYLLMAVLPRQHIRKLDIVVPFFGPATMERVDKNLVCLDAATDWIAQDGFIEGVIAAAEPCLKLLSSVEGCAGGRPTLHFYDLHAIVERFYVKTDVVVAMQSALPALNDLVTFVHPTVNPDKDSRSRTFISSIAFPDEGAFKRFGKMEMFRQIPVIVCAKIRDGDCRKVIIRDMMHENKHMWRGTILIIDDLVQSGSTLRECRNALIKAVRDREGETATIRISAYVTHAVFPNESWKAFAEESARSDALSFDQFFVTNSIPSASALDNIAPFRVLRLEHLLAVDLVRSISGDPMMDTPLLVRTRLNKMVKVQAYVASKNRDKLKAAYRAIERWCPRDLGWEAEISVEGSGSVSSCVSEQPMGSKETKLGAMNRINALEEQLKSHKRLPPRKKGIELTVLISFENGITLDEIPSGEGKDDEDAPEAYSDVPCAIVRVWKATSKEYVETCAWGTRIKVPTHLVETSKASNQTITVGALLEAEFGWPNSAWHCFLDEQRRERWEIMCDTCLQALSATKLSV